MSLSVSHDHAEHQLVDRVRQGDGKALRLLFDRYAPDLHRLAFRLLASRDDADDVVQDVFVGLRAALGRYTEQGGFGVWLRRVTTRAALMRLRSERRREATARHAAPAPHVFPQADALLGDALSRAIAELPPPLRAVFVLRMIEDYSYDEIADTLGVTVSAGKVRLHRALRRLRPQLQHLREDR